MKAILLYSPRLVPLFILIPLLGLCLPALVGACAREPEEPELAPETRAQPRGLAEEKSEPPQVLLILDGSGSMWGKVRGQTKIAIARSVLKRFLGAAPTNLEMGLMVYGHRRKEDCQDIELMVSIGKIRKMEMLGRIETINPLGHTPLAASLQRAAEVLKNAPGGKHVLLVTDGKETCHGDPCTVAEDLKRADIDFVAHVVGFDIGEEETRAQLQCIANATGGLSLRASDAEELAHSLNRALETAVKGGSLKVTVLDVHGDLTLKPKIFIQDPDDEDRWLTGNYGAEGSKNPYSVLLPPEKFDLFIEPAGSGSFPAGTIEIVAGETIEREFRYGELKVTVLDSRGRPVADPDIRMRDPYRKGLWFTGNYRGEGSKNPYSVLLPPGEFDIRVVAGEAEKWTRGVVTKEGQIIELQVRLP
ncbi:VWA domain-containing protein [Acidobacteria bacterium AH-259-O06]|nr:VWA domain-containing protein [Acidobacteria bacterium AH-259-O06]